MTASLKISTEERATSHRLKYLLDVALGPLGMPSHAKIVGKENSATVTPCQMNKMFKNYASEMPNGLKTPMRKEFYQRRNMSNHKT